MNKTIRQALQWPFAGILLAALLALAAAAHGAAPLPLSGYARPVIEQFLSTQTAGLPGQVQISIDAPHSGSLPPCDALEAFLPGGALLRGRVSVGVRCNAAPRWTRYVQARIALMGTYLAAARQIEAGQALGPADTVTREADMTTLPASVVVDSSQLEGQVTRNRIAAGAPVRREQLRGVSLVQQGQTVKVVSRGPGFVVSTEGKAMAAAAAGALVQVRMQGGQLLTGTLGADGIVDRGN
ncbi:MAG: flagellar basal body P-ring formation chaperone FlgA [Polaromonas sp.]